MKLPKKIRRILVILLSLLIVPSLGGLGLNNFLAQQAQAATYNFTEDFSDAVYKDNTKTTADWNTTTQSLKLLGSSGWYKADGSTIGANNVSSETSVDPSDTVRAQSWDSLVLDSNDYPHIAWKEIKTSGTFYDIFYSEWDGSRWVKADGITPGADQITSAANTPALVCVAGICDYHDPSLVLDSQERPMVAFHSDQSGYQTIAFSRWNGTAWTHADGTTAGFEEYVEDQGYDRASPAYEYDREPSLAVTSDDRPAIAWMDETSQDIWYREFDTGLGQWVSAGGVITGCQVNVPSDCRVGTGTGNAGRPSLAMNSSDEPEIAWTTRSTSAQIRFVKYNSGTNTWQTAAGVNGDDTPSAISPAVQPVLRLDGTGKPHISFYYNNNSSSIYKIYYTSWNGANWVDVAGSPGATDVSTAISSGTSDDHQDMVLDSSGRPAITWRHAPGATSDIAFTHYNGTTWVKADGVTSGYDILSHGGSDDTADFPSLGIDSNGNPNIANSDAPTSSGSPKRDLFFTRWRTFAATGIGQSTSVDIAAGNITSATLTSTLASGAPSFWMSNDGGTTFEAVTSGTPHTFVSTGADLRWKASLSGTDEVTNVAITYTSGTGTVTAGNVNITATVSEHITCSLLETNVYFGTVTDLSTRYGTTALGGSGSNNRITMLRSSSNAANGYVWTVKGGNLSSGSDTIEAVGPTAVTSQSGQDQLGINVGIAVNPGGPAITVDPQYSDTSTPKYALATTTDTIVDVAGPSGQADYDLEWIANRGAATKAGNYTSTDTFICTGRF